MKVKCNNCGAIFEVSKEDMDLHAIDFPIGLTCCPECKIRDFSPLKKRVNNKTALDNNLDQRFEDIKHTMKLFRDELIELIKTYIDPWIK